jgi:ankyrin repeat protein
VSTDGRTALHLPASGGHDATVRLLVAELGLDKDATDNDGRTALHRATSEDHKSTVRLLVELGADNNVEIGDSVTQDIPVPSRGTVD